MNFLFSCMEIFIFMHEMFMHEMFMPQTFHAWNFLYGWSLEREQQLKFRKIALLNITKYETIQYFGFVALQMTVIFLPQFEISFYQ